MKGLSGQWDYSGSVAADTRFFEDIGMKSLDFVILSSAIVRRYGPIPFDKFYAELAERPAEEREVTVSQYVDFICKHLPQQVSVSG